MTIPVVMSASGAVPTPPITLNQELIALAVASNPGLTANLPGTLIEDIASTDTGALVLIDQARVETINSVTPFGANLFLLNQLGQIYGVPQGTSTNTSVYVTFTGTPGYVIPKGTIVSDGSYQYVTQDASVISSGGTSASVYCVATISGSWAVPANTVTTISSSVPAGVTLTVTNPLTGIPSTTAQTTEQYRQQVLGAGLIGASGMVQAIKTYLQNVPGVVDTLISVVRNGTKWEVIVGGGDPYAVANAIFQSVGDPGVLTGSSVSSTRDQTITIYNTPDSYNIIYVIPVQQTTSILVTWNSSASAGTISNGAVQSLCAAPIQAYVNSLGPGQGINIYEIQYIFQEAVASILPTTLLTHIAVQVTINSVITPPSPGTGIVTGDVEGYYYVSSSGVTTVKG